MARSLQYVWASPNTLLGLLLALLALPGGGRARLVGGVLEVHGPALGWLLRRCTPLAGGALAITFGHVVLSGSAASLQVTRSHERVHVRQYERWGPLFIPAYLLSSVAAALRGDSPYRDNRFEREAYARSDEA